MFFKNFLTDGRISLILLIGNISGVSNPKKKINPMIKSFVIGKKIDISLPNSNTGSIRALLPRNRINVPKYQLIR